MAKTPIDPVRVPGPLHYLAVRPFMRVSWFTAGEFSCSQAAAAAGGNLCLTPTVDKAAANGDALVFSKTLLVGAGLVILSVASARAQLTMHDLAATCAAGHCTPQGSRLLGTMAQACVPSAPSAVGQCVNGQLGDARTDELIVGTGSSSPTAEQRNGVTVLRGR